MSQGASETTPRAAIVHRPSGDPAQAQHLGPYRIEPLLRRDEEATGTVYRVRIEPDQRTAISFHRRAEEYYFVLAGGGTARLDGVEHALTVGDFLRLPPGTTHGFVAGPAGLEMLDIHTPGCWPDRDTFFVDAVPDGFGAGAVASAPLTPG